MCYTYTRMNYNDLMFSRICFGVELAYESKYGVRKHRKIGTIELHDGVSHLILCNDKWVFT